MPYRYYLPDGSSVGVPDNMPIEVAEAKARQKFPELYKQADTAAAPSMGKTVAHGAESGVLPGLAGLAGGRLAGAAASWLLGPEVGIPVSLISLTAGLGTSVAAGYGQEKALEAAPGVAKALGQDPETRAAELKAHPYARAVGEGIGGLAGMRPNLRTLLNATTRNTALAKMGTNAAIGAGIDAGFQLYNGQPYDPIQGLIAGATQGLGTEENRLGRRVARLGEAPINRLRGRIAASKEPTPSEGQQGAEKERVSYPPTEEGEAEVAPPPSDVDLGALFAEIGALFAEKPTPVRRTIRPAAPEVETTEPPPGYDEELPPPTSETAAPVEPTRQSRDFVLPPEFEEGIKPPPTSQRPTASSRDFNVDFLSGETKPAEAAPKNEEPPATPPAPKATPKKNAVVAKRFAELEELEGYALQKVRDAHEIGDPEAVEEATQELEYVQNEMAKVRAGETPSANKPPLPSEEGWATRNAGIAAEQTGAAERAEQRLDTPQYPAANEQDHAEAVKALESGQFVVAEAWDYNGKTKQPSAAVFHTTHDGKPLNTISDANDLVAVLTSKTAERPDKVQIIPPFALTERRNYNEYPLRKGEEGGLHRTIERVRRMALDKAIVESENPNDVEEVTARFNNIMGAKAKRQPLLEPEIRDAVKQIEELNEKIKAEQKAEGKEDTSPTFMEIPATKGRPVQFVPSMNVKAGESEYKGIVKAEELPESVAAKIEARKAEEDKKRAEKAAIAKASEGRGWKPNKKLSKPQEENKAPPEPKGETDTSNWREINFGEKRTSIERAGPGKHRVTYYDEGGYWEPTSADYGYWEPISTEEAYEQEATRPKHDLDSLNAAVKNMFGVHTKRLIDSGFLNILPDRSALPKEEPASKWTRGMYSLETNKAYLMAAAIPRDYDLKGLLLHEIGVHAGMETMLGKDLYKKLLTEVKARAEAGDKPFVEADNAVRSRGISLLHEDEERLAYLVSKHQELPFVKRIFSQLRQWLWQKMGGRFLTLTNDDIAQMALASYRRAAKLAEAGRAEELRRTGFTRAFSEEGAMTPEEVEKFVMSEAKATANSIQIENEVRNRVDQEAYARDEEKKIRHGTILGRLKDWFGEFKQAPYRKLISDFQDINRPLLDFDRKMRAIGRMSEDDVGLYGAMKLTPSDLVKSEVNPLQKQLTDAFRTYIKKEGLSEAEGLANFNRWMTALTEEDLRKYLFSRYRPLNDTPRMFPGQKKPISPAALREALVKAHETVADLTSADAKTKYGYDAKSLRDYVDYLGENFSERGGHVPETAPPRVHTFKLDQGITNIEHPAYDLAGITHDQAVRWREEFHKKLAGENGEEIQSVIDAERALREKVNEINFLNGHSGQHFLNAIAFQNRNHYYSLKGDVNRYDFNPMTGVRLRGELGNNQAEMGGRTTIADNPLTQTIADSNVALSRYDKKAFLDKLLEVAHAGTLRDSEGKRVLKVLDPVTVGNRRTYELPEGVNPKSIVLRPNEEGGYDVIQIKNAAWQEAIKGVISVHNPALDLIGKGTRFITAGVTRYNPGFGLMNGMRHFATNFWNIASEYGPVTAMKMATRLATQFAKGSPAKAAYAAHLVASNNNAELARLGETDSFYRNIDEWRTKGGRIAFNMAYSNESATKNLVKELRGGMLADTKKAAEHVADVWNNTFEFMNREAAYDTLKKKFIEQGADPDKVLERAAFETKNLLNLQLSGKYSNAMASWFGLFRAEATGAVRQIDAILEPLFKTPEDWIRENYGTAHQQKTKQDVRYILTDSAQREKALSHWQERRKNAFLMTVASLGFGYAAHKMAKAVSETDDEGRNLVGQDDYAQWVRNLRVPTTILGPLKDKLGPNNKFINIPWGFGAGAFASIGAQLSALEEGDVKPLEATQHMMSAAKESFMPVSLEDWGLFNHNPVGWAIASAAPTPIKPALYLAWNADSYGRQIYNTRIGKYGEAYAGGDYVPEMFKSLSKELFDATDGAVDLNPHTLQFFANNYIQGVANVTQAVVGNYQNLMGEKEFDLKTDVPVFSSLVGRQTDADARNFSDTEQALMKAKTRMSALQGSGNYDAYARYIENHPTDAYLIKRYDTVKAKINGINKQLNKARASDMTPKEYREQADALRMMRSLYMKDLNDDFREFREEN